jgi:hypothetical protein
MIYALNTDSIDDPKALIEKLKPLPVKPILGVVVDEGRTAEEALAFAEKLAPYVTSYIWRIFDSYSLMLRDRHGKATGPRYTLKSYVERTQEFCKVLGPTKPLALELGNELSPNDAEWLPPGIWGCVAKALDVAKAHGVTSLVTWFAWSGMEAWMERQPLMPDIGGISYYPRTSDAISDEAALLALQRQCGGIPKMISEYGSQRDDGSLGTPVTEIRMIEEMERYTPPAEVEGWLGSVSWNALARWKYVSGLYQELWGKP